MQRGASIFSGSLSRPSAKASSLKAYGPILRLSMKGCSRRLKGHLKRRINEPCQDPGLERVAAIREEEDAEKLSSLSIRRLELDSEIFSGRKEASGRGLGALDEAQKIAIAGANKFVKDADDIRHAVEAETVKDVAETAKDVAKIEQLKAQKETAQTMMKERFVCVYVWLASNFLRSY